MKKANSDYKLIIFKQFNNGVYGGDDTVSSILPGTYPVVVNDRNSCPYSTSVVIPNRDGNFFFFLNMEI